MLQSVVQQFKVVPLWFRQRFLTLAYPQLILNISKLVPLKWAVKDSFVLQVWQW